MVRVIRMFTKLFLDRTMILVLSCDIVVMVTNRYHVFRVTVVVMICLITFVVQIFGIVAFGKLT